MNTVKNILLLVALGLNLAALPNRFTGYFQAAKAWAQRPVSIGQNKFFAKPPMPTQTPPPLQKMVPQQALPLTHTQKKEIYSARLNAWGLKAAQASSFIAIAPITFAITEIQQQPPIVVFAWLGFHFYCSSKISNAASKAQNRLESVNQKYDLDKDDDYDDVD